MATARHSRRIDAATVALAAGGVGLGGYVVGKSLDTSRTTPPGSAIASYAVLVPAAAGVAAYLFTRNKNHSAATGALIGAAAGALWAFFQFPTTPAGIAASVQSVISAAQNLAQQNQQSAASSIPMTATAEPIGASQAMSALTGGAGAGATPYGSAGVSHFLGANPGRIPLQNRFIPGSTPRIGGTVTMAPLGRMRRAGRRGFGQFLNS